MKKGEISPSDIFLWQRITKHPGKILDFGCGRGRFIDFCSQNGLEIKGTDSFKGIYKGWYSDSKRILKIRNQKIPVESNSFNIVVSNQVLEHIELSESKIVVEELMRVLTKDGFGIHIFPTRLTLIEPHVGIIGAHWIRSRRLQRYYSTFCFLKKRGIGVQKAREEKVQLKPANNG
jgi:2-polyprenyl-3-methyl-5-hydroxy-6-metoxy-1,4-benzoquinol methylase